jgi:hypothetical protein
MSLRSYNKPEVLDELRELREKLIEAGYPVAKVDAHGKLPGEFCIVCDAGTPINDDGMCANCTAQEQGAPE